MALLVQCPTDASAASVDIVMSLRVNGSWLDAMLLFDARHKAHQPTSVEIAQNKTKQTIANQRDIAIIEASLPYCM